jgi:hypothetical protein
MAKNKADYDHAQAVIDHWVDTLSLDDTGEVDTLDIDSETQALDAINLFSWHAATDTDLAPAVARARHYGASWRLIALMLGTTPAQAHHRFNTPQHKPGSHPS